MSKYFGKIIKFHSEQVIASHSKSKYHVTLSLTDRSFLFINSNGFDDSFEITKADWAEMPKEFSFVSCNAVIRYDPDVLKKTKPEVCGELSHECLISLREHLSECEVMETRDLNYVIDVFEQNLKVATVPKKG